MTRIESIQSVDLFGDPFRSLPQDATVASMAMAQMTQQVPTQGPWWKCSGNLGAEINIHISIYIYTNTYIYIHTYE